MKKTAIGTFAARTIAARTIAARTIAARTIAARTIAACTIAASTLTVTAQAQPASLTPQQVELYAEMWALAGVCNQLEGFYVLQEELAERLNRDLSGLEDTQFAALSQRREAKLEDLREALEQLRAAQQGNRRVRGIDETVAALMTRCNRLADNGLAGDYFGSPL